LASDPRSCEANQHPVRFPIVGIGASAGGLEAFLVFLKALPPRTGMAFILVQHLEPNYESQLPEILSRATAMPVVPAKDGLPVEKDCLYVIPPNAMLTIKDRTLHLSPRSESPNPHYPIDQFFVSLAQDQGSYAIGVILSGSSSDGAQGLTAIKCAAGTTFCQDEESAKYDGMPHSAIATGAVDFILPPPAIAGELARISAHPYLASRDVPDPGAGSADDFPFEQNFEPNPNNDELRKIFSMLRRSTGVDFTQYKENTIRRRIARRMLVNNCTSLAEYAAYLDRHSSEITDLYRDILISVTQFFREPETFASLARIESKVLQGRDRNAPFRVWCAGCATGEEAYSLAIVMAELMEAAGLATPIQLFGTDVSEIAIDRARSGDYPDSIRSDVSPDRLSKFFTKTENGFRISRHIRETCIFARHDLTKDPPFSQLDLVSCRNLLIYLDTPAQQRILSALHYSLKPGGLLLLGSAESVGSRAELFNPVVNPGDNEKKIFSKMPGSSRIAMTMPDPKGFEAVMVDWKTKEAMSAPTLAEIETRATRILRDLYAPPGVTVNDSMQIVHFHGRTSPYLEPPTGEASLNLLRVAHQSILFPLRKAIDAAAERMQPVEETSVRLARGGETREITLRVIPISEGDSRYFLVLFEEGPARPALAAGPHLDEAESSVLEFQLAQARRELDETREYLRKIVEQHEVAIEELRAAHEEVQSSNEEMQSTNEELRTAKEELQSSNEELRTVNDELQNRNDEIGAANNDLSNVLNAVSIPIVMVGMDFRIRRFTPAAVRLLNTAPDDLGRSIADVHYAMDLPALQGMLSEAIQTLAVQQSRIQTRDGRWFSLQVRPYRTTDDRIDGAVITFLDIDDLTRALASAEAARDFAEGMVETVQHPLLVLDNDFRIQRVTSGFYKDFQVTPNETLGQSIFAIGDGQWNISQLRTRLEDALNRDVSFRDLNIEREFPKIGRRTMRLNAQRISGRDRTSHTLLLAIEDVTERKEAAEIQYRRLFESARDGIVVIDGGTGQVIDANPFFLELTRYSRPEIVGQTFSEIPPFRKAEEGRTLVQETNEKGIVQYDSVNLVAQDGRQLVTALIANRYRLKDQSFIQVNIRDVTQRRQAEDDLRRSNLDLQQFAFAASHDLQEPLRTVINQVELFQREYSGKLGPDADEIIQFITAATDRMRHMVLDLLNYSQIARASIVISATSMEAVLATAMSNLQLAIANSDARITFDPLPTVWMDHSQAVQLLQNLIGNALKYRSADSPRIHLSARQVGNEWIVAVKDNGLGIEPRFHQHIFTVFKRLHGKEYPGTGIGLATCNRIAERHGGRIWVESEVGKGSTFFFSVPIPPESES
jgi:two-component system, chemotaxis family, CheB/CheR fusion protein